jgi:hypothetical protein
MTIEQLRNTLHAQPFRPFRVHLADGRSFDVEHPEFLASTRGGRTIIIFTGGEGFEIIDLLLVTSLEVVNGKQKRKKSAQRRK